MDIKIPGHGRATCRNTIALMVEGCLTDRAGLS